MGRREFSRLARSQLDHFQELIPHASKSAARTSSCRPAAQTLGMALHELAANAGKYGSLSNGDGKLDICWSLKELEAGAENCAMSWRESGGPPADCSPCFGYGKTIICAVTAASLDAKVDFNLRKEGLSWRIECNSKEVLESARPAFDVVATLPSVLR